MADMGNTENRIQHTHSGANNQWAQTRALSDHNGLSALQNSFPCQCQGECLMITVIRPQDSGGRCDAMECWPHEEEWHGTVVTAWHPVWDQMKQQNDIRNVDNAAMFVCDLKDCICWSMGALKVMFSLKQSQGRECLTSVRPSELVCPWGHQWTDLDEICSHRENFNFPPACCPISRASAENSRRKKSLAGEKNSPTLRIFSNFQFHV